MKTQKRSSYKADKLADYIFYADCHGLISISPWDPVSFHTLKHTAMANPQRFPVYGTIPLQKEMVEYLNELCRDDAGKKIALNAIKGARYNLPTSGLNHQISILERIPNDSLDPYWHDPEKTKLVKEKAQELLRRGEEDD